MKQLVTILLSVSLFVPPVARMMAFTKCSIVLFAGIDPNLCDCTNMVTNDMLPVADGYPDKQKEISSKIDWKYIGAEQYRFTAVTAPDPEQQPRFSCSLPENFPPAVFHPPAC